MMHMAVQYWKNKTRYEFYFDTRNPNSLIVAAGEHSFVDGDEATYVDVIDIITHPDYA